MVRTCAVRDRFSVGAQSGDKPGGQYRGVLVCSNGIHRFVYSRVSEGTLPMLHDRVILQQQQPILHRINFMFNNISKIK
jgi:hypothetical protein